MSDRDLLATFDAALPQLERFPSGSVPKAGSSEFLEHQAWTKKLRTGLWMLGGLVAALSAMTGLIWPSITPWFIFFCCAVVASGGMTAVRFLQLAFGIRLEQALPPGTDAVTARLEDDLSRLIHSWNFDASIWNWSVETLRHDLECWQRQENGLEPRDIDWSEAVGRIRGGGLIDLVVGFDIERRSLMVRRLMIDRALRRLNDRLHRLKASEDLPMRALSPSDSDRPSES